MKENDECQESFQKATSPCRSDTLVAHCFMHCWLALERVTRRSGGNKAESRKGMYLFVFLVLFRSRSFILFFLS